MNWIRASGTEFVALFIDDVRLAVAMLAWLAICWLILPRLGLPAVLPPVLLFVGLLLILAESTLRRAGQRS